MSCKTHNLFKRINSMKRDAEPSSRAGGGGGEEQFRGWFPFKPDLEVSVLVELWVWEALPGTDCVLGSGLG